jgi:hypothetical protein
VNGEDGGNLTDAVSTAVYLDGVLWRDLNESKRYAIFSPTDAKYCHTLIEIFLNPTEIFS